jgi:hypothetical protein
VTTAPFEARCDRCKQTRPLFLYEPEHNAHLGAGMFTCRWCTRDKQPLLCVRCWGVERQREEDDPSLNEEAETLEQICATNRRIEERKAQRAAADAAACEGIAAASREAN